MEKWDVWTVGLTVETLGSVVRMPTELDITGGTTDEEKKIISVVGMENMLGIEVT